MKVLLSKNLHSADRAYLNDRFVDGIELLDPPSYTEEGVLARLPEADVLLGGLLTEPILKNAAHLRFLQIPWTGVDNLDFRLIREYGAIVCNSHSSAMVVAEHAVALQLAAARKLAWHDQQLRQGNWNRLSPDGNEVSPFSTTVFGSKVLLVGYGGIGKAIAQLLRGFNCRFSVVNNGGRLDAAETANVENVWPVEELETAVATADTVFIAVPLTTATHDLFDDSVFDAMQREALLVNVSRGAVVNENALYRALSENLIGGAAIDTWYNYPSAAKLTAMPSSKYSFEKMPALVLSPHRAGYAKGGFAHLDDVIDNLNRSSKGEPLLNVVSSDKEY